MCGNSGPFHGTLLSPKFGKPKSRGDGLSQAERDQLAIEQQAATQANLQVAATRRKRRVGSLIGGGRSVLGAASGQGAASGGGTISSGSGISAGSITSALGAGRSFGGMQF